MNRVLSKFFNLPPHIKMMLALAGFGSMASIIFFILPALRSKQAKYWIIGIFVVALVLFGIIYLIRRMFGKKKASALDSALESQGPTRGDIAEQEQIYKEKFKSKLAELKTNGLSVYKLPWFVLMGEPGSGKTATLINSGLDFPLGKDEVPGFGGTRNYNWWFTNTAVILDTAGRIAFQEEGTTDKVEWEYFIKLLKANRPRCPINGIIVAIPADKLLRDSSEEREQKATVLRERLRQVHQLLGVRFPTFLIVTKMDLVGGFNEFFDEIRPDLQQRNQMFGWSRPEEFQSSYDPATFMETFDGVYHRLRDWAMRYLQRAHATDQELGLVVTFPEAFRQIRGALNDYVATIFQKSPLLEPPFFRGFYFTSSVQEGAPIFDVFSKSMGGGVVETRAAKTVDSKAFFIHDFYEKKVFPEQGLVFRSAKHVTLNKRMRRMVWMGSTAMASLMLIFFLVGALKFRKLLTEPRADCAKAAQFIAPAEGAEPPTFAELPEYVKVAGNLSGHILQYRGALNALSARMMFPFANMSKPRGLVSRIHAKYVLVTILEPTLREFSKRITRDELPVVDGRDAYLAALKNYALWYGETVGQGTWTQPMTSTTAATRARQFETILACLGGGAGTGEKELAVEQVRLAFEYLADGRAFAADVLKPHVPAATDAATMAKVVSEIQAHYGPFTDVMGGAAGVQVQYWIDLFKKLGAARTSYEALLALKSGFSEDFESTATEFIRQTADIDKIDDYEFGPRAERGTFCQVWYSLAVFLNDNKQRLPHDNGRILSLRDLFSRVEQRWLSEFQLVEDALLVGSARDRTTEVEPVYRAIEDARASLKNAFADSLAQLRKEIGISGDEDPLAYYVAQKLILVRDTGSGAATASLEIDGGAFGQRGWLKSVLKELRALVGGVESISEDLKDLSKWPGLIGEMKVEDPTQMESVYVRAWFETVSRDTNAADNPNRRQKLIEKAAQFQDGQTFWMPAALYDTADTMWKARQDVYVGRTLRGMAEALRTVSAADRLSGLARLRPGYDGVVAALPYEENEFNSRRSSERAEPTQPDQPKQESGGGLRGLRGQPTNPVARPGEDLGAQRSSSKLLVRYHTRKFLVETMRAFVQVDRALEGLPVADQGVKAALKQAAETYADTYFSDWYAIYSDSSRLLDSETLGLIRSCGDANYRWPDFEEVIAKKGFLIGRNIAERLAPLLKEAVFAGVAFVPGNADDDRAWPMVENRLNLLAANGKSLPSLLIRSFQGREDVALDYAGSLQKAWREYATQVSQFGPLAGENPAPGGPLPDVARLRRSIIEGANIESDFPCIAPLTALASYGDKLLIYHLENKLATIVKPNHGKYPLLTRDDIPDPNRDELKLRARVSNALEPVRFLAMLRDLMNFRKTYGALYKTAGSESGNLTLARCKAWETLLYGDEGIPNDDPPALPKRIGVNVVPDPDNRPRRDETINPGSICEWVCVVLPVLDGRGSHPAGEICVQNRGIGGVAAGAQDGWSYYWQLSSNPAYQEARVWMKDFKVAGWKDEPAWTLPASPWALPLLLRSQEGEAGANKVSIPVVFAQSGQRELGMYINIEFERPFPGPIPLLADPEPVRGMAAAPDFLTGKGGR